MEPQEFEDAFARIRESGIASGDSPRDQENMKGPGLAAGAKGMGKAVYFKDPDGHLHRSPVLDRRPMEDKIL